MVETVRNYRNVVSEIEDLEALIADSSTDAEMRTMARGPPPHPSKGAPRWSRRSSSPCFRKTQWTSAM